MFVVSFSYMDNLPVNNSISTILPIFNEADSVAKTICSLDQVMGNLNINYEIIAVNDGSTDKTEEILASLSLDNIKIVSHDKNRGYGASLKTGIKIAQHPWILITDADGTYPEHHIPELIAETRKHDMVIGARNGVKVHDTFFRKIGRGIVQKFASYVSGSKIEDINSGMRIFKKENAEKFWSLFPDGFSFTSTITVASHSNGHRVKYIPIDYNKRSGKSSIKPAKDFIGFMSLIAKLAIYYRPLKVFVPLALILWILAVTTVFVSYFWLGYLLDATIAVLLISGVQVLIFGFLADMIVKRFYND